MKSCNCSELGCKICKPPYKFVHTSSCGCKSCDMRPIIQFFLDKAIKSEALLKDKLKDGR